jgi:hypothetical protein
MTHFNMVTVRVVRSVPLPTMMVCSTMKFGNVRCIIILDELHAERKAVKPPTPQPPPTKDVPDSQIMVTYGEMIML